MTEGHVSLANIILALMNTSKLNCKLRLALMAPNKTVDYTLRVRRRKVLHSGRLSH